MVDVAIGRGEYAKAATLRWGDARRAGNLTEFEVAARLAYDWSQYSVLTAICEDWLQRDPKSETAHRFLAVAALELDRRDMAQKQLDWLLESAYPTRNDGFESLGRSLGELRNRVGVAAVIRALSDRHPESADGHLQAGNLLLAAGDAGRALKEAQQASLLGKRRQGRSLEARARVLGGDCEHGLILAGPLGTDIRDLDRLTEAWLMMLCERGAEAESILQELIQRPEQRMAALEALAGRELETHRSDAAGRHYADLAKAGDPATAQFGLAALADRMGNSVRAAGMYSAITSGRHAVEAQLRAYRLHVASDGVDIADRVFDEFVFANPDLRRELSVGRMMIMADLGQEEAAVALGARLEKAYPDAEEVSRAEAEVLLRLGKVTEAVALLERLLARRPHDPAAQNALGYTLTEAGRDLRRADRLLMAANGQAPDNAAYIDSLGWLRFKQRDVPASRELLLRAYRLQPDAEIAAHVVQVLFAIGADEEAERFLVSALERHTNDARLLQLHRSHIKGAP
jgi:tetratricopeptide (TPR) repeat protein